MEGLEWFAVEGGALNVHVSSRSIAGFYHKVFSTAIALSQTDHGLLVWNSPSDAITNHALICP